MKDLVDYVGALIRMADGEVVGKTRFQKIAYLLEAKELGFGLVFDYHNYGPYSPELAFAADDAESLGYIWTKERRGLHAVPYTIFSSTENSPKFGGRGKSRARKEALKTMNKYSALVLELTATAVYLKKNGYAESFWDEVRKRKGLKATPKRMKLANRLVDELDL